VPDRRWAALTAVAALLAAVLVIVTPTPPADAAVQVPFAPVYSTQDNGAITLTGNSQMSCPASAAGCSAARAGTVSSNNNNWTMAFVDADSDPGTANSTSATLSLPSGSTVLYALLTWGGRQVAGTGGSAPSGPITQVKVRAPGATGYTTLTGTANAPALAAGDYRPYESAVDVTGLVRAAGNGTYWVADIAAATGVDRYAGWSLTVAYRNPAFPLRDLSVFRGFADVTSSASNSNVAIPISGFLTPAAGPVNAAVGVVAWEGDQGLTGDAMKLGSTTLSDSAHPADNFFTSAIADSGATITGRNPAYVNNLGIDVSRMNATNVLPNGATSTTVHLTTSGDFYYPTVVTTQIDLFTPAFNPISKTVVNLSGNDPAQPGDTLEYRLTFTNTGQDFADRAVITDALPAGTSYVPGSILVSTNTGGATGARTDAAGDDTAEYDASSRIVRLYGGRGATASAGGTLNIGDTVAFRFRATVQRPAAGSTIGNTAVLDYRARTVGKDYTFVGNSTSTPVGSIADLSIAKTSDPAAQTAGSAVTYRLTATNAGPNDATGVVVTDTLPPGVTVTSATGPAGTSCSTSGRVVTCTTDTLANGDTLPIALAVTIDPSTPTGSLTDTATVRSATPDDVPANNSAAAGTTVQTSADVSLTMSADTATATAGGTINYTLTASNAGPSSASGVLITDPLPTGTSFVSASAGCTAAAGTVTCRPGTLDPGQQSTATITVRVGADAPATPLTNTATVIASTADAVPGNNSATIEVAVDRNADLAVNKQATSASVVAGTAVTYTVTVTNNGPSDAAAVQVTDPTATGLIPRAASSTVGTCAVSGAGTTCQIGSLAAGTSATVTVHAVVGPAQDRGALDNTATATAATPDAVPGNNSATASVTVTRSADLALSKSSTPSAITWGDPISYQLTVANNGPSTSTGIVTSDPLPDGLVLTGSPDGCAANAANTVTCAVGSLQAGEQRTVTFTADTPATPGPGTVANTASVTADTPDPVQSNNTATAQSSADARADLAVSKSVLTAAPQAGGTIDYQIIAVNNGPSDADGVVVTDPLPAGIGFASGTWTGGAGGSCTAADGTVSCPLGALAVGQIRTITITGVISDAANGVSVNTAQIAADTTDPSPGNNASTAATTIRTVADVAVTLTPQQTTVTAGTQVAYDLRVVNNGPSTAANVVVTGQVPPGMTPVLGSSVGACVVHDGTVTCPFGDLPKGADVTVEFRALVNPETPAGDIPGTARVGSTTPDSDPANNASTPVVTVVTSADLEVRKDVTPDPLVAGGTGSYTITVINHGPSDARAVHLADTLPADLTASTASSTLGSCAVTGQVVGCDVPVLGSGQSATILIPVAVSTDAPGPIGNSATVTADTGDPVPGNNSADISTAVEHSAALVMSAAAGTSAGVAGAAITYTLVLINNGPSDAINTVVSDPLPAGLSVLPGGVTASDGVDCNTAGSIVSCAMGTLPAGQSRTIVITALVAAGTADGATMTNTATVTSDTTGPVDTRTSSTSTPVTTAADVRVSKAPVDDPPEAGTDQSYVISVANDGPSTAREVLLTDPLPDATTFVSAIAGSGGSCSAQGGEISCPLGDLVRGSSTTVRVTVHIPPDDGGASLTNTASAVSAPAGASPTPDPDGSNNASTVRQTVATRSDLVVAKEITSGPIVAGAPVAYRATVTNNGPSDAAGVRLDDPVPAGTTLDSVSGSDDASCQSAAVITCRWDAVPAGQSRTVTRAGPGGLRSGQHHRQHRDRGHHWLRPRRRQQHRDRHRTGDHRGRCVGDQDTGLRQPTGRRPGPLATRRRQRRSVRGPLRHRGRPAARRGGVHCRPVRRRILRHHPALRSR
jgi:uncharacterized repeat protein (TIGR01451 family)